MNERERVQHCCDTIEEWYEFMLAYAAQGIADDRQSQHGSQLRELLTRAVEAAKALPEAYGALAAVGNAAASRPYASFLEILQGDAVRALAAMELVLAQPRISSQLIDNLNASLHVRTLLTDVFLLDEIVQLQGVP